jgi:peptidyl-tRNA hydrolase
MFIIGEVVIKNLIIPTQTCISIGPDKNEKIDLITKYLKLI